MTPDQAAKVLDGARDAAKNVRVNSQAMLKANGLVAVFGASDDLMEFRGAVNEVKSLMLQRRHGIFHQSWAFTERLRRRSLSSFRTKHKEISRPCARWDVDGFSWKYETAIPHAKFIVKEDDSYYCEGIVFALSDVPSKVEA